MALTSTQINSITKLAVSMFGAAPGGYMSELVQIYMNAGYDDTAFANALASTPAFKQASYYPIYLTNEQVATKMAASYGLTGAASTQAYDYFLAGLNGGSTIGSLFVAANNFLATTQDPNFATAAATLSNKAAVAEYYTVTMAGTSTDLGVLGGAIANVTSTTDVSTDAAKAAVVANSSAAATGQTFTLTASADTGASFTGGTGNDSYNGVVAGDNATGTTINAGDNLSAGAGTDTVNISVSGAAANAGTTTSAVTFSGVEKVLVNNFQTNTTQTETDGASNIIDMSLADSSLATVGLAASSATGDTKFSNLKNMVGAEMRNGSGDLTVAYNASVVAGTTDTQNLTVSNISAGTFKANGAETIAITTELAASTLKTVSSDSLSKITVAGDKNLTVTDAITATTVDASAFTGNLTVKAGANAAQVITGGAGSDVVDMNTNLGSGDTVNGGTGTDTLKVSTAGTVAVGTALSKGALYNVSGFEVIDIASTNDAATLDMTGVTGVTNVVAAANQKTIVLDAAAADTAKNTNSVAVGFTLNGTAYTTAAADADATSGEAAALLVAKINTISGFTAAVTTEATITITSTTGEAVEFALTSGHTAEDSQAYNDVTFSNLAAGTAVDIYSADAVTASLANASGSADALSINLKTVAADKGFNKSVGTVTANNIETITLDATGMSNFKTTTVGALTGNAMATLNITGDSDVTISAFTGSTALATINGSTSTGDLSLAAAPAAKDQSIRTGSGNDTITMGAFLNNADTIDGGANSASDAAGTMGKDTLTATVTGLTATTGALNIANVERINLTNAGTAVINAAAITGAQEIAFAEDAGMTSTTLSNLAAGTAIGLGLNGTANAATALGTITASLADATGTADSLTFNLNDTTDTDTNTATLKVSGVETVNLAYSTTAAALASYTFTATDLAASKIVVSGSDSDTDNVVTLNSLNAATTTIDASAFKGKIVAATTATGAVTVSATGTIAQNITTGAGNDTITLAGNMGTTVQTVDGGAGTGDVLNVSLDNANSDFTSVSNVETINITVGGNKQAGFNNGTKDNGLNSATTVNILGGDSLSTFTVGTAAVVDKATATKVIDASAFGGAVDLTVAAGGLNSFVTIKGGASTTDTVRTTVSTAETGAKVASMTGIETLVVSSTDNNAASSALDLTNATGLVTVDAQFVTATNADKITLSNLAAGVNVKATSTKTADNLVVTLASTSGTSDSLNFELTQNAADAGVFNLDVAGIETLNITNKATNATASIQLDGVTATSGSATAVTVAGAGASTLTSMSSSITSVNASTATGALTIAAADRTSSAMTITGGEGADSIAMKNTADVLTGGAGSDTLKVSYTAILGGIQVDLSATDVITSIDGATNSAVQTGFENVDLSAYAGFGAVVTGSTGANTIVGTASADNITGGLGADNITGGAGNDQINLTETTDSQDTVVFSAVASNGADTISGFVVGSGKDVLNVSGLVTLGTHGTKAAFEKAGADSADKATVATSGITANGNGVITMEDQAAADWSDVTTVIGNALTVDAIATNNSKYVIVIDNGTDSRVYLYSDVTDGFAAGDLTLVATLSGVTTYDSTTAKFDTTNFIG